VNSLPSGPDAEAPSRDPYQFDTWNLLRRMSSDVHVPVNRLSDWPTGPEGWFCKACGVRTEFPCVWAVVARALLDVHPE
jgi:hypothetical protein